MKRALVRVVKVGGSLLEWPDLPRALRGWLATEAAALNILVSGGGRFVDAVRQASGIYSLSDEAAHWLAVDCLSITARMLATICQLELVLDYARLTELSKTAEPTVLVYDPRAFLTADEAALWGRPLPHDWTATSDSIAARLAEVLPADELVLLKSCDPPAGDVPALTAAGYVDENFGVACESLSKVKMVNLRAVFI